MMKRIFTSICALVCAAMATNGVAQGYTDGVFIVNEDWFGHNSGTVNFYSYATGGMQYRVFQKENAGNWAILRNLLLRMVRTFIFAPSKTMAAPAVALMWQTPTPCC